MKTEWTLDIGPHLVAAHGSGHTRADVYLDDDGDLEVHLEAGSGHMRSDLTTYIPKHVLLRLLEGAGFKVAAPEPGKSEEPK